MKSLLVTIAFVLGSLTVVSQTVAKGNDGCGTAREAVPHLQLDSAYINLGKIERDTVVEASMGFCNTGDAPLQILRIFSDCGCTSPEYPTDEVLPGEKGEIKVRFNGKNRQAGAFRKTLRILTNADNRRETIAVKGIIDPKK